VCLTPPHPRGGAIAATPYSLGYSGISRRSKLAPAPAFWRYDRQGQGYPPSGMLRSGGAGIRRSLLAEGGDASTSAAPPPPPFAPPPLSDDEDTNSFKAGAVTIAGMTFMTIMLVIAWMKSGRVGQKHSHQGQKFLDAVNRDPREGDPLAILSFRSFRPRVSKVVWTVWELTETIITLPWTRSLPVWKCLKLTWKLFTDVDEIKVVLDRGKPRCGACGVAPQNQNAYITVDTCTLSSIIVYTIATHSR
ncbi:hypothetical protein CYMTET_18950, partial [Cymbomonas tetramitiformis]